MANENLYQRAVQEAGSLFKRAVIWNGRGAWVEALVCLREASIGLTIVLMACPDVSQVVEANDLIMSEAGRIASNKVN